jgi:hypothetical protein
MTERLNRDGGGPGPVPRSPGGQPDLVPLALDRGLYGRMADLADGRSLVVDFLITRPSWAMPDGELSVRLQLAAPPGFVRVATLEGVPCMAEPRLVPILREAGVTVRPVAGAVLGQLELDLERPWAWLDFLSTAARRP